VWSTLQPPVEVGEQYTASIYLKRTSAATISIGFVDATDTPLGTQISANGGGAATALTTSWVRFTRTFTGSGTGPRARLALENPNLTGGSAVVHAAAPQLEKGAVSSAWVPGQGPALVVITGFDEPYSYPRAEYTDCEITLEEIGGPL
jgi:Carbohydrate binding domain